MEDTISKRRTISRGRRFHIQQCKESQQTQGKPRKGKTREKEELHEKRTSEFTREQERHSPMHILGIFSKKDKMHASRGSNAKSVFSIFYIESVRVNPRLGYLVQWLKFHVDILGPPILV